MISLGNFPVSLWFFFCYDFNFSFHGGFVNSYSRWYFLPLKSILTASFSPGTLSTLKVREPHVTLYAECIIDFQSDLAVMEKWGIIMLINEAAEEVDNSVFYKRLTFFLEVVNIIFPSYFRHCELECIRRTLWGNHNQYHHYQRHLKICYSTLSLWDELLHWE